MAEQQVESVLGQPEQDSAKQTKNDTKKPKQAKEKRTKANTKKPKQAKKKRTKTDTNKPKQAKAKRTKKAKNKTKFSFIHSMRVKVMLMISGGSTVVAIIMAAVMGVAIYQQSLNSAKSAMTDLVDAYAVALNDAFERSVTSEFGYYDYYDLIGEVSVNGIGSTNAFLLETDGLVLFHPNIGRVGQYLEIAELDAIVEQVQAGNIPDSEFITYEFSGRTYLATYGVLDTGRIFVISVRQSDIYESVYETLISTVIVGLVVIIIIAILSVIISGIMMKPLVRLSAIVEEMSGLRFVKHKDAAKMQKKKDEIGLIYNSISELRDVLETVVVQISGVSENLHQAMGSLESSSNAINLSCSDNSATTEQLAAGMQETTATTETINMQIEEMRQESNDIRQLSVDGEQLSAEIETRAYDLQASSTKAVTEASNVVEKVHAETMQAIENAKVVEKINELTNVIMGISSETSLLALNASIEAARAGEAGRGFSVVAAEIGKLANQTSDTVADIDAIVEEVGNAVTSMTDTMNKTTNFLEQSVLSDYSDFVQVSDQYVEDSRQVKASMTTIQEALAKLNDTITEIAGAVEGINATLGDSAIGVTNIAAKTTDVVGKTLDNEELVRKCRDDANDLQVLADMFKLET